MEYLTRDKKQISLVRRKVLTFVSLGAFSIVLALVVLNVDFVQIISNSKTQIRNGSETMRILQQEFPALRLYTYLFNVTNAEEFLRGDDDKLKVQEVGPFTYLELRSNTDMEIDEEMQVLRYSPRIKPVFLPEESIADPRDVNVTMPNVAMLAMSSMISSHGYFSKFAFNLLLNSLKSQALVKQTAEEFLWGYDEPLIRLGNTVLPGWISFDTLGIMDRMYDKKVDYRLEVASNIEDKFKVKLMNGFGGLKNWDYEDPTKRTECNTFNNVYEGIAYPNMMTPGTPVKLFRNVLCRILELEYQGQVTTEQGAKALQYMVGKTNYDINNNTECLCARGTCITGISDVSPCYYGLPLAISNAHFLYGDPNLFSRIEGLNPSEEKHGSEILIEPKIGMVLKTSFTVQINLAVNKADFNKLANRFSDMVVPLCYWKLMQPDLNERDLSNLKLIYVTSPTLFLIGVIILFLVGTLMLAHGLQHLLPKFVFSSKGIIFRRPGEPGKPQANAIPLLEIK